MKIDPVNPENSFSVDAVGSDSFSVECVDQDGPGALEYTSPIDVLPHTLTDTQAKELRTAVYDFYELQGEAIVVRRDDTMTWDDEDGHYEAVDYQTMMES